jgi:type IV pilus assembly protein PilC
MPIYRYTAVDGEGKEVSSMLEADSDIALAAKLREKGLFPTGISELRKDRGQPGVAQADGEAKKGFLNFQIKIPGISGRVSHKELTAFTRQLATMFDAGLSITRALGVLRAQQRNAGFNRVIQQIISDIEAGESLCEALDKHPKVFDKIYVNMVRAGEMGGSLRQILSRLAEFGEKQDALRRKVKGAAAYPVFVLIVAIGLLTFIMLKIVPKFEDIFASFKQQLPAPTLLLIAISRFFQHNWYFIIPAVIIPIIAYQLVKMTRSGKFVIDVFRIKVPVMGTILQKLIVSRFCRTFGTLYGSGVPILQALLITRHTVNNELVARAINKIQDKVKEGEGVAAPLEETQVFPLMVSSMIAVGEETGEMPKMLIKVSEIYDDEVDAAVEAMISLMEPALILVMGVIVGFIVISLFLPLINVKVE